jgi:hypothetical protein
VSFPIRYATLAYGSAEPAFAQAAMLLVSLLAHAPEPRELMVVTDRPERFAWFGDRIVLRPIEAAELESWRGPAPFSMRQKIEAALAVLPPAGALVLLDADTLCIHDPGTMAAALESGALLLHKREFELGASRRRGNRELWAQLRGRSFGRWRFEPTDAMWNSGVIALPASDAPLLREALALYDELAGVGIRHFATEQLVVARVFGRTGRLAEARQWFTHYWGNKEAFTAEITRRLAAVHDRRLTPAEAARELRANPIELPSEVRPGNLAKIGKWLRG